MTLTTRRKRPLDRKINYLRDTRLVIIATEGELTESQYFDIFGKLSSRVHIKVLPTENGLSAPKHVLERLRAFRNDYDLRGDDALCLVVDKDRWPDVQISEVASEAVRLNCLLAVSNPCFEVWLLLHHSDPPAECNNMISRDVSKALRTILGQYNKSNLNTSMFEPHINLARGRAANLDVNPGDRWPNQFGTRVYKVVDEIIKRL